MARVGGSEGGGGGLRSLADAPAHLRPSHRPLVDGELVAQGQVLQGDMAVSAAEEGKQSKQAEQEGDHRAGIFSGSAPPDQSLGAGRSFGEGQVRPPVRTASLRVANCVEHHARVVQGPKRQGSGPGRLRGWAIDCGVVTDV